MAAASASLISTPLPPAAYQRLEKRFAMACRDDALIADAACVAAGGAAEAEAAVVATTAVRRLSRPVLVIICVGCRARSALDEA
jgi:hypothetical protein